MTNPIKILRYDTKAHIDNGVRLKFYFDDTIVVPDGTIFLLERSENGECYLKHIELVAPIEEFIDLPVLDGARYRYRIKVLDDDEMEYTEGPRVLVHKDEYVTNFTYNAADPN